MRKYLRPKTLPEPQKRPGRESKLDPFKPYILEKLKEGPYTARLYPEIKEMNVKRISPSITKSPKGKDHFYKKGPSKGSS
ncbi:Mobile element protein [Methanosarcina barkeri 3]|uniref:Mobile element protein n=1 Tax=Methanosarcina barkeri 3 TaxID=1434107 RepID=A0A0E3WV69_METBA|nr:Mobile element protein [Methanosarcina barkeri 3]